MSRHPSRTLVTCCGHPAPIDVDMIPIVTVLWRHGVHTCNGCCQGNPGGRAYISFPDVGEADKFTTLAMSGGAAPNLVAGLPRYASDPAQINDNLRWGLTESGTLLDGEGWHWWLYVRFPLIDRCQFQLDLPNAHLDRVAGWLQQATAGALKGLPTYPQQVPVSPRAGDDLGEDEPAEPLPRCARCGRVAADLLQVASTEAGAPLYVCHPGACT